MVAREYGIPCIVNVANATQLFKSGELIIRMWEECGVIINILCVMADYHTKTNNELPRRS